MTFNVGHVDGGTGAGRKRPLRDKPKPWLCGCPLTTATTGEYHITAMRAHMARCTSCGARREDLRARGIEQERP